MRIFSGIQPTGRKHLGNYIGAIRQYVEGQDRGEAIYCIVDLHALTVAYDPSELRERLYDTTAILLAADLDPDRCILFRQSDVKEHTELCWLLANVTAYGELGRMHQFKEKSAEQREFVSAGLFFYPVLQAADVLAYQTNEVPVGEDQKQHIELMRDIATRFNSRFGDTFAVPEGSIRRKFKSAVTDSGRDIVRGTDKAGITNLIEIMSAVRGTTPEAVEKEFAGASGYAEFKQAVGEAVTACLAPVRERYGRIRPDQAVLEAALSAGAEKARAIASETVTKARARMGIGSVT